jgi:diguanylate cyclase (GGDEF)-like protein
LKKIMPSMISSNGKQPVFPLTLDEDQQVLATALAEVSIAINGSLELDEVLDCILENLGKVVTYKTANIMLIEGSYARIVKSRGYEVLKTRELLMSKRFEISEISHLQKMVDTKVPILSYFPHIEQDWNVLAESEWIKSHIASPIISNGEVIGFLNCDSDIAGFFSKLQSTAIQIFASEAGQAITNARLFDASNKMGNKFKLINELTRQVLEASSLDEIFKILPEKVKELSEGSNVYISKWDEATQTVAGWAATGHGTQEFVQGGSEPGDHTITGEILETRQPIVIDNVINTEILEKKYHSLYQEKTLHCLPLISKGVKLGAIIIGYDDPQKVTDEIRRFGEYAAMQISTAIAKIRSLELERIQSNQLTHANALIESLSRVATAIKSGIDTEKVMSTIGSELELLKIHSVVALRVGESDNLGLTYSSVQNEILEVVNRINSIRINDLTTSIDALHVFRQAFDQQAQYIDSPEEILFQIVPAVYRPYILKLKEALLLTESTKCILVPLVVETKAIGLMALWAESLQKIDIQAASIFGGQVAIAIENANLLQEVQRLAITDELTNVLNRRGFDEVSSREFGAAKRYSRPLSLIMLDIDRFKAINDVYGHPIGDEILVEIAARAKVKIRDTDYIARYGGEEFLILLIEQNPENAKTVAERIRKSVAEQPFVTSVGKIAVTISVGVTGATSQTSSINMMIKTVDKALYKSKENGRNRVTLIDKI